MPRRVFRSPAATIDLVEPIYGLGAIGLVYPSNVRRNSGARPGDKLLLGKGLEIVEGKALVTFAKVPKKRAT